MPSNPSSTSVFGRFRRTTQSENEVKASLYEVTQSQEGDRIPFTSPTKVQHQREHSLRSLSSELRRSASLRSHHSQHSIGAGQRQGTMQHSPPTLESGGSPTPPSPTRHRSKLSFSTRPFSRSLKSSEALALYDNESIPDVPQIDQSKKSFGMLSVAPFSRSVNERQFFASTVSLPQTVPPTSHGPDQGFGPPPSSSHGGHNPQAIYQQIQDTAQKRMSTIHYIRRLHEGDVYFFNTLHVSQANLSQMPMFNPQKMGRRATSYFHLGHSLPILLDLKPTTPVEYLRPLSALLQEFETYQSIAGVDGNSSLSRRGMGAMLKSGMGLGKSGGKNYRRTSTATDGASDTASMMSQSTVGHKDILDLPSPGVSGHEFSYLLTPQLPFDPDFGTSFSTLCDTLISTYSTLLTLITGPEVCGMVLTEAFNKVDKSIRKILVANVVKEFEEHSRSGAKVEVAGLSKLVLGGLM